MQQEAGSTVDYDMFVKFTSKEFKTKSNEEELRESFKVFDKDGQGYLSIAELRHIMTNLGEKLSKEELEQMISEADPSGTGQVSYNSFVKFILHL